MDSKKVYYKSDFTITEHTDTGYAVPFKFIYYTAAPTRAFVACYDGHNYHNCRLVDGDLVIGFDDHNMGLGILKVERRYYINDIDYATGICDEVIAPAPVVINVDEDGHVKQYHLQLGMDGDMTIDASSVVQPYWVKGDSAYQVAVDNGFVGTEEEWLASLVGPQGPPGKDGSDADVTAENIAAALGYTPQAELVSGVNIKTINNQSLLGSGNIDIQGGGGGDAYEAVNANVTLNSSTGKYEFSASQFSACQSAWSAGKIPLLQLVDTSSQQIKVVARIPMFPYGQGVPDSFRGLQQYGTNKFYYAYVVAVAANSYAQSVTMQEEITDLDTIRANASAGAMALQEAYQTITASVTLNTSTNKYEFASSQFSACNTAWSAGKIPVLKLVDESTQVVKVLAWVPMFPYGQGGIEAFYGVQQKGQTSYFFAYVGGFTHSADSYAIVVDVQTEIADLETIRSGASAGATAYQKPSTGIPASDLAEAVQTSLGKADTALQSSAIANMEVTTNKVTSLSSQSTDTQYPRAKCVYNVVGDIETLLAAI